jgi:antitoxin component YwqK of YwqJK toxin-antitoxin module
MGFYKTFYDNGQLETVSEMKEGSKSGAFRNYDREGHLILEGNFLNGRLHGDNTAYYANGTVKHRFKYDEGFKTGAGFIYHPNGTLKIKEQFAINGDWVVEEFTDSEKKVSVKRYRDQKPEGLWVYYHDDGKTEKIKENYEQGKLSGIRTEYAANGKLLKEETYKFDMLNGSFKTYYENGSMEAQGEFRSSRRHGLFTAYYPNGKIKEQGEYIADKKHKEWKEYDDQGNVTRTYIFKAGILIETK